MIALIELDGPAIHKTRCLSTDVVEIENNIFECQTCGLTFFEQMYTTCDNCDEMTVPIDDDSFDGKCPSCGVEVTQ